MGDAETNFICNQTTRWEVSYFWDTRTDSATRSDGPTTDTAQSRHRLQHRLSARGPSRGPLTCFCNNVIIPLTPLVLRVSAEWRSKSASSCRWRLAGCARSYRSWGFCVTCLSKDRRCLMSVQCREIIMQATLPPRHHTPPQHGNLYCCFTFDVKIYIGTWASASGIKRTAASKVLAVDWLRRRIGVPRGANGRLRLNWTSRSSCL
jgi:hypothetical protein